MSDHRVASRLSVLAVALALAGCAPTQVRVLLPTPPACTPPVVYTVVAGDTLWGIAKSHGVTVRALLAANPEVTDRLPIRPGDRITISPIELGWRGGAHDINNLGQVLGIYDPADDTPRKSFLWQDGVLTELRPPEAAYAIVASALNDQGQVVGYFETASPPPAAGASRRHRAFLWQDGVTTDLGTLGGDQSDARDINEVGQVIGWAADARNAGPPVIWQDGRIAVVHGSLGGTITSALTAINDRGWVVGVAFTTANEAHAFLWGGGVMIDLGTLGGSWSEAHGVNERGQVVGTSTRVGGYEGPTHAFLWEKGTMTDLGTLGGSESIGSGVNSHGQVVGSSKTRSGAWHGFLWRDGQMTDLGGLVGELGSNAVAINDCGQIVGLSTDARGHYHAVLWAVASP